jgi:hypothetical protein
MTVLLPQPILKQRNIPKSPASATGSDADHTRDFDQALGGRELSDACIARRAPAADAMESL